MAVTSARKVFYKDTLQPALHRRFSSTAGFLLVMSYLEALSLTSWKTSLSWPFIPISSNATRSLIIFACGLPILILRIAHYHVDIKTTPSGLYMLGSNLLRPQIYETGFWYLVSSVVFTNVFLSCTPPSSNLGWVTHFSGDRVRLNERPLFILCYLAVCAVIQAIAHYASDIDGLRLGARKLPAEYEAIAQCLPFVSPPTRSILAQFPAVFSGCIHRTISALVLALLCYYTFCRSFLWGWALSLTRPFYNLPKTSMLPPSWPTDVFLLGRCMIAGMSLNFVWLIANLAFSVYMVQAPLRDGEPLTSRSKQPNDVLLNGLKNKKLSIKAFATWELALIAQGFPDRRKAIFNDIDRKGGTMWVQIFDICTQLLRSMEQHIETYEKPAAAVAAAPVPATVKQRRCQPLRQDAGLYHDKKNSGLIGGVEKTLGELSRSPGATPISDWSPLAQKTWKSAKNRMLSKKQQEALSSEHIKSEVGQWISRVMDVGWVAALVRQDFDRRVTAVVFGATLAEPSLYMHAAQGLCQMAIHSLEEDDYGNVQRDVVTIIRILMSVVEKVEAFKAQMPTHWTDPSGNKATPTVDAVTEVLRAELRQVVDKFEPYRLDLGLTAAEIRQARVLAPQATRMATPREGEIKGAKTGEGAAKQHQRAEAAREDKRRRGSAVVEMKQVR
ncbi:hypothetical protein CDD81_6734 [Ophiocordyceps australis]|uniref:Nucleoporin NDC1 n=1 Tax=Ophiocordyceps australis TaxID=1399860 RepID=A0A2C5Y4Y8_9HYPO|nr:hypothetical protein CDD81_6734 [Ophiocordyceps australis]